MPRFLFIRFSWITLAVICLTGCGSGEGGASRHHPEAFRRNITTWSRPLDPYTLPDTTEQYAQILIYAGCMKQHGYQVPAVDPSDYVPPNINAEGYKLFNLTFAAMYGYHNGPTARQPDSGVMPGDGTGDSTRCTNKATAAIKNPYSDFVQNLRAADYLVVLHSAALQAAASRWHTCMLPLGLPDLPSSPDNMPTFRLAKMWGLTGPSNPTSDAPQVRTSPSTAEIRIATYDARCRQSADYTATLYQGEVNAQQNSIEQNDQRLVNAFAAEQQENAAVARVLRRNGH